MLSLDFRQTVLSMLLTMWEDVQDEDEGQSLRFWVHLDLSFMQRKLVSSSTQIY